MFKLNFIYKVNGPELFDVLLVVIVFFSFYLFRQSVKHQSIIKSQLKHKDIIASLCEDTIFSFHSCLQLAEQMTQSDTQVKYDLSALEKIALPLAVIILS